jgi:hypothetical protein
VITAVQPDFAASAKKNRPGDYVLRDGFCIRGESQIAGFALGQKEIPRNQNIDLIAAV